jgi:hypothetical protein
MEEIIKEKRKVDGYKIKFSYENKYTVEEMLKRIIKSHITT